MEIVGPLNMAYILLTLPQRALAPSITFASLPFWNKVMGSLYILHYTNRAIVNPLFLAPSIAPIHFIVAASAVCFNFANSSGLGGWIAGYGRAAIEGDKYWTETRNPWTMYFGLALFFIGMAGNIVGENTLFRLRREETAKRVQQRDVAEKMLANGVIANATKNGVKQKNPHDKVYVIPSVDLPLFSRVLYPHYVLEWMEWTGFLIIGGGMSVQSLSSASAQSALITVGGYGIFCDCVPALVFLVNEIACMAPRAWYGKKWYVKQFGEDAVAGRGAVIPKLW